MTLRVMAFRYDAADAVTEILLDGFGDRAGLETAPLTPVG